MSSARGMKSSGGIRPCARPVPSHQRLCGHDLAGLQVEDRLVVGHQLRRAPRPARSLLRVSRRPTAWPSMPTSKKAVSFLPRSFTRYMARSARRRSSSASSASADMAMPMLAVTTRSEPSRWNGESKRPRIALRRAQGVVEAENALEQDGELVAAQPRHRVGRARGVADPAGGQPDQLVPGRMAETVVHRLEVVEIDHQHGDPLVRSDAAFQGVTRAVLEQGAVRDAREGVRERLVLELIVLLLERAGHPVERVPHLLDLGSRRDRDPAAEVPASECPRGAHAEPADGAQHLDSAIRRARNTASPSAASSATRAVTACVWFCRRLVSRFSRISRLEWATSRSTPPIVAFMCSSNTSSGSFASSIGEACPGSLRRSWRTAACQSPSTLPSAVTSAGSSKSDLFRSRSIFLAAVLKSARSSGSPSSM